MSVELYPHQQKAVDEMHNGCILRGGVGTGKTITSLVYYFSKVCKGVPGDTASMREPKDLIVITTAKKRDSLDWEVDAAKLGVFKNPEDNPNHISIKVDSWNNIEKYRGVENAFFIFDEQRLVGSGAWTKAFINIAKDNEWVLLSATPGDTWLDYIPVFVANGFYKNRTAFKREHVVYNNYSKFPKVERYTGVGHLLKLRASILVEMPYVRHTKRIIKTVDVDYDRKVMEKVSDKRWHVFEERPLRDVAELFSVMRKVANSDLSRLRALEELMETHPKLIVFYNFDYELEMLRTLAETVSFDDLRKDPSSKPSETLTDLSSRSELSKTRKTKANSSLAGETHSESFSVAEWNGHKHQEVPTTDRWLYLVQYVAGAEGWNCIETDAICFFSLTYSYKNFHQAQGRIDRLNTPFVNLYYYILRSKSMIDTVISKSLQNKENFNETKTASKYGLAA